MELFNGKYQMECLLGRGAFSEVWKVTDIQTGVVQALKIYSPSTALENDGIEMMKHEFSLMANASHQNLLRPLYFDISDQRPFLVLSYCKNGNIKKKVGHFSEREAWKLLKDAASGLAYLHEMNPPVIHQDIKPENILIADNGSFMLTDFGVSTRAMNAMSQISNEDRVFQSAGTFPYMPPEKFSKNNMPIFASDIWSLGVTVYELLMGDLPFGNEGGLRQEIGAAIPEIQGDYSSDLREILVKCMAKEPWERPKADELEKIAVCHLAYAPTIMQKEDRNKTKDDKNKKDDRDYEKTEQTIKKKYVIAAVLIGVVILTIFGFVYNPFLSETQIEPGTVYPPDTVVPGKALDTVPESKPLHEPISMKTTDSIPVPELDKKNVETKTIRIKKETGTKMNEKDELTANAPQKGNLPYGSWSGKLDNGKPVGCGTMVITSSVPIRCSNGKKINVLPGDEITDAEFDENGYLYVGTWKKTNGQTSHILP